MVRDRENSGSGSAQGSGWRRFWERGGFARAILAVAVYLTIYVGVGRLIGALLADQVDSENLFASTTSVFFGLTLDLIVGAVVVTLFVASLGWFPVLFARQPVAGSWWMWLAPLTVVAFIVLRLLGIDYASYALGVVVLTLATGLLIGFVEEVITRGIVVKMLRDGGWSEWVVMASSSLIFALMHSVNAFSMPIFTVAVTVVFTFGFGVCMYLTLRATGNLIWPVLIHAFYDPTGFLATGGIDKVHSAGGQNSILEFASSANIVVILLGIVGVIFVRGHAQRRAERRVV